MVLLVVLFLLGGLATLDHRVHLLELALEWNARKPPPPAKLGWDDLHETNESY
jgi:hypothetical protein